MIEVELVKKAQEGDQEAVTQIFDKYRGFVMMKSRNYFLNGADREDLLQEGMIGLLKAIRAYEKSLEINSGQVKVRQKLIKLFDKTDKNKAEHEKKMLEYIKSFYTRYE